MEINQLERILKVLYLHMTDLMKCLTLLS